MLVVGVGTGGTVTGTGRYLKERKPDIEIVGADPVGSIYSTPEPHSYLVEGVGEDFWPTTFDRDIVDRWIRVSDREAFATTRRLARLEGILIGASGGMALHAALRVAHELPPEKTVLVDPARRRAARTSRRSSTTTGCSCTACSTTPRGRRPRASSWPRAPARCRRSSASARSSRSADAIALLQRYAVSQLPVIDDGEVLGCVHERTLLDRAMRDGRGALEAPTSELMSDPLPVVQAMRRLDDVYHDLQSSPAVLVADGDTPIGVLTRADVLEWLAHA